MDSRTSAGWALLRVTFGGLLAYLHGAPKIFEGNVQGLVKAVAEMGFPFPTFFAWCAAFSEFAGGLLIAVGLLTRPAAAFAGFTLLVASYRHLPEGLRKMELALLFFALCVFAAIVGGGRYSLDHWLRRRFPRFRG